MLPYRDSRFVKIIMVVFFLLLSGYGYFEAQAVLFGPRIFVPSETIVVHDAFLHIQGRAENISELRLNGGAVSVTENGVFSEPYLLTPGENRIVLDAEDKYGRKKQQSIEVIYTPDPSHSTSTVSAESTRGTAPEE